MVDGKEAGKGWVVGWKNNHSQGVQSVGPTLSRRARRWDHSRAVTNDNNIPRNILHSWAFWTEIKIASCVRDKKQEKRTSWPSPSSRRLILLFDHIQPTVGPCYYLIVTFTSFPELTRLLRFSLLHTLKSFSGRRLTHENVPDLL